MRTPSPASLGLIGVLLASGCAVAAAASFPGPPATAPSTVSVHNIELNTTFTAPSDVPGHAVTYDRKLVPAGSRVAVSTTSDEGSTTVRVALRGLKPDRRYGAHVHTAPCGATGDGAGPSYQHVVDPVQPSRDPQYANPENEIWLDFRTDKAGAGSAQSTVNWGFTADRRAHSVVVHALPTATKPGKAGAAGDAVACVTVDF